ncbi:sulfotransferase family protein [Roseivivax sp. CAU 1753]
MAQPTFFLGLGGQKCGSSWVQAYLARAKGSNFGRLGEYQIWEHRLGGVFARYAVAAPTRFGHIRARAKTALGGAEPAAHLRWRLQQDPTAYFDYFAGLLNKRGVVRTGDITPSYAALPSETLKMIRQGFEARGIATKAIFVMRDPVERLRSHMRMEMEKGRLPLSDANDAPLRGFYASAEAEARSRYDRTLEAIEAVFPASDRHIALFEEIFTPEGTRALAEFAGVPVEAEAGARQVNARGKGSKVSEDVRIEIARHYAPVYAAVAERLPQVRALWPGADRVL